MRNCTFSLNIISGFKIWQLKTSNKKSETSDWHLQTIMKNDFPIKNFRKCYWSGSKIGLRLTECNLGYCRISGEIYSYPSQYWSQSPEASTRKTEPLIMFIHKTSRIEGYWDMFLRRIIFKQYRKSKIMVLRKRYH